VDLATKLPVQPKTEQDREGSRSEDLMANWTDLTPAGFVDDLFVENATLEISRTGGARYSFVAIMIGEAISVDIWTTQKARISVRIYDGGDQEWVTIRADGEVLESLTATNCDVHFEQLDRAQYFLGLYRGTDKTGICLHAPGYIKARPVERSPEVDSQE
jgi:hypothetical protein